MVKTVRIFSLGLAVLFLLVSIVPSLSGQQVDEKDRLLFQKFRMTRPDLLKGEDQLKKKQFDKAEQSFLKVLQEMPENAQASFLLADTYYQKGEFEKGLESIVTAEKNFPLIQKIVYRRQLGMISQGGEERGDYQTQLQSLQNAYNQAKTDDERARIGAQITALQRDYSASGQTQKNEQKSEVMTLPAEYSYVHGNLLIRMKRYQEALEEYLKAVQTDSKHGRACNNIANIYYMSRQYDKALEYIEKAEAAGAKVNPEFKKAVLVALGK
jgi:tetratricopeptide (TPR) repeat protein